MCGDLADMMNSTKDFVLLALGDAAPTSSLLMGNDATEQLCAREQERTSGSACAKITAAVAEKEVENPGSFGLGEVLPICMGLRFCNDDDVIDGSVKFGFVTSKTACVITAAEDWPDKPTLFSSMFILQRQTMVLEWISDILDLVLSHSKVSHSTLLEDYHSYLVPPS